MNQFGPLPSREKFTELFAAECPDNKYIILNHELAGRYSCTGLWDLVESLTYAREENEEYGDIAFCILRSLGWTWK